MASAPEVLEKAGPQYSTLPEAVPLPVQEKEVLRYQHAGSGSPLPRGWRSLSRRCHLILIAILVILVAAIIGTVVGVLVHKNQAYVMHKPFQMFLYSNLESASGLQHLLDLRPHLLQIQ